MSDEPPRKLKQPERNFQTIQIPDDTPLTQYGRMQNGNIPEFRNGPRSAIGETGISLLIGQVDATAATLLVCNRAVWSDDLVRHTTAGDLRAAGFDVAHDPVDLNGLHALVTVPIFQTPWNNSQKTAFKKAFEKGAKP